ncbi:MAG: hypothetical protein J3K34DRAFT_471278 [Monoraphidium minutum]|nr:MAG: hypothetical protein J3K34DRAFT_471278 [Monoraphidium minutum]
MRAPGAAQPFSPPPQQQAAQLRELKRELGEALARLPGLEGTKQRVLALASELERAAPFRPGAPGAPGALLGEWALVFASDGTVVTRAPPAQLLAQLASLPGVGLDQIRQELGTPTPGADGSRAGADGGLAGAGVSCSNGMVIGLGPFGTWQVRIRGHWQTCHESEAMAWRVANGSTDSGGAPRGGAAGAPGLASEVAFDGLGVRLQGVFGLDLGKLLPELTLSVPRRPPRAQPNWRTTFCDGELRIGRGVESGGVFLFQKQL